MEMNIKKLIEAISTKCKFEIIGNTDGKISGLTLDSRKVVNQGLFAALKGTTVDGHDYIEKAIQNGAKIVITEIKPEEINPSITYLVCQNSAEVYAHAAFAFYNISPSLKVVGVTGTNGKTTVATILFQLFRSLGCKCGLISTVENKIEDETIAATHTTPDAGELAKLMSKMQEADCEYIFMEVSSHALDQKRVVAVPFVGAIFTNITHDHLDYHKTFLNYVRAKQQFFNLLQPHAIAITNIDDKNGKIMVEASKAKIKHYSLQTMADYKARILSTGTEGLQLQINGLEFFTSMVGEFNAYNLIAVFAMACELGFDKIEVLTHLSSLKGAEGRMEQVVDKANDIKAFVDYAHTPDALENVLITISKVMKSNQQLITVIGCGGDRDKTKRPEMAKIAVSKSHIAILTSDNPRTEDPNAILADMEKGIDQSNKAKALIIADRAQAIKTAVMLAKRGDIILVAGKGHEKYQDINGEKLPFEDKKVLETALSSKS